MQKVIEAGSDLDAPAVAMRHGKRRCIGRGNDDVVLIDGLLDAGADVEREGRTIDGGPALSSAWLRPWVAARRLVERGA